MTQEVKEKEDWMQKKWRPAMGWMYMVICTLDMAIFPILWSMLQVITHENITQWQPLTLQGAGLFHLAMGAVLGIAAFGRTQEKIAGANNGGLTPPPVSPPPYIAPPPVQVSSPNIDPINTSITTGFGGKKAPPPALEPML
jgi:hypothetical protein